MKKSEIAIIKTIKDNLNGRKIALRWKDEAFEKIMEQEGLAAAVYISDAPQRIDNIHTFPSSFLEKRKNEYYLIISSALQQNVYEKEKYTKYGYKDERDILWMYHQPIDGEQAEKYDNQFQSESEIDVKLTGWGANVKIGKNVKFPKDKSLVVHSDSIVYIGDYVNIYGCSITLSSGSEIVIEDKCNLGGVRIFLNVDGKLKVGEESTFGSGIVRTGRNQSIIIGKDCMFSWDIALLGHDGHMIFDLETYKCTNNTIGERKNSIVIGNHVWIGGETAILPHSYVGSGSVLGYRTLVKGSFPNNCIIGGTPGKILKKNIAWLRENTCYDENMLYEMPEEYRLATDDEISFYRCNNVDYDI